jgi:plastocyanin
MRTSFIAALLASAAAVSAQQTFNVLVGANDTLTFQPDTVNASVGDTIAFTLYVCFVLILSLLSKSFF